MDIDCCNICGEDHSTEYCPELGLDASQIEFDQLSTRARLTLPPDLQVVDNGNGLVGVVAKKTIPAKTQFGPFEAKRTTHIFDDTGFFTLKLIGRDGATVCLDTTDENECNWLCLVRAAVSSDCANCMAYQLGTNIFYSTKREITPGDELQVWYAPHFAKKLGKPTEPAGDSRVLLGHRIEPLASDIFGDTEFVAAEQTDGQTTEQPSQQTQTGGTAELKRGEIKKAFYCPRCGNTFSSQTAMVQHLREHVLSSTQNASAGTGKKRGRGRPRLNPLQVPEFPKRGRGRPRKNFNGIPVVSTPVTDKPAEKRKRSDEDDGDDDQIGLEDSDLDDAVEIIAAGLMVDDTDKDYNPVKELSSSGKRVQPKRSRKGKNSWLGESYVVSKIGQKVKEEENDVIVDGDEDSEGKPDKKVVVDRGKILINDGTPIKRGRGRPKKIKELVKNGKNKESEPVIEILYDIEQSDATSIMMKEYVGKDTEKEGNEILVDNDMETDLKIEDDIEENNDTDNECGETNTEDIVADVVNEIVAVIAESTPLENNENEDGCSKVSREDPAGDPSVKGSNGEVVLMYEGSNDASYGCVLCGEKFREEMEAVSHFMSHSRGSDKYNKHSGNITAPSSFAAVAADSSVDESAATAEKEGESSEAGTEKKEEDYPCDICQQSFKSAQYLYRHMIMHTDIFNCVQCKKTFSRKDSLQKHILKCCPHLAEMYRIYACKFCSRVFSTRSGHMKHNLKCQSVQCIECSKIFTSSNSLDTHICRKDDNDDQMSGKFSCGVCPKTFQSMYYLKQHILLHDNLHSCNRCGKSLPSKDDLEEHEVICQTLEAIKIVGIGKCDKCEEEFNHAKAFREHYLSHSHPYQCEKCLRRFVKIGTLSSHDCQSASDEFVCGVCGRNFKNKINLDRHIYEHGCMKYECSDCSEQFHMKSHAKNHMCNGKINPEAKIFACSDTREVCHACGKSFSTKSNLTKHMLLHGEKNYSCPHCEKRFHLDVYLKDHITCVHYNIYKYQCTQCGKMLKSKTGLIAHTKLFHSTNIEAHPCPKCGKIFKQKGNLRTHMFSHSTEKKFSCTECVRSFKYPDQLSRHKLEHKSINKLSCPECDKTFYRGYEMKKHMQIYHSGYVYVCGICSSRCGHRHTLVRHYKRKHAEDFSLLSQEGYIDSLLKHVNDIYPNVANVQQNLTIQTTDMTPQGVTVQTPDMGVQTQGIALQGQSIIIRNVVNGEDPPEQEVASTPEMLSRDAAEALQSLAMGTVTARQYQILKDKGLFSTALATPVMAAEVDQSVVSESSNMIQPQEALQQEQVITDGVTNLQSVSMDAASLGMVQNKDGTLSIGGVQGMPQGLEGLGGAEGQIVILQIVDSEGQEMQGLMPGEIIQQLQTGGIIQANQEIIHANQEEIIQAIPEENEGGSEMEVAETVQDNVLTVTEVNTMKTEAIEETVETEEMLEDGMRASMQVGSHEIATVTVEQGHVIQGHVIDSNSDDTGVILGTTEIGDGQAAIQYLQQGDTMRTDSGGGDNQIAIHYIQQEEVTKTVSTEIESSEQPLLTEHSESNTLTEEVIQESTENLKFRTTVFIDKGEVIRVNLGDRMDEKTEEISQSAEGQEVLEGNTDGVLHTGEATFNRLLPDGEVIQLQSRSKVVPIPSIVKSELLE